MKSTATTNPVLGYLRLTPARLPIFVLIAALLATVMDGVAFALTVATDPEGAAEQASGPGRILSFAGKLLGRTGSSLTIGLIAFLLAYLIGRRIGDVPLTPWGRAYRDASSPAAKIAGVLTIFGGAYALVAFMTKVLPWTHAIAESDAPDKPAGWIVALIVFGLRAPSFLLAAITITLGVLILRRVTWARHALIIFFVLLTAGLVAWFFGAQSYGDDLEASVANVAVAVLAVPIMIIQSDLPMFGTGMLIVSAALAWAALRERGSVGSLRECWRGLLTLALHLPFLAAVVFLQMYDMITPDVGAGEALAYFAILQTAGIIVMMFLSLWALAKDENPFWAVFNAWVVVCAPLLISMLGLIASIFQAVGVLMAGQL